jgi:hypothetical protein
MVGDFDAATLSDRHAAGVLPGMMRNSSDPDLQGRASAMERVVQFVPSPSQSWHTGVLSPVTLTAPFSLQHSAACLAP